VALRSKHSKRSSPVRRTLSQLAQLKVRLPEPLRRDLERAGARAGHSMNAEIVKRLTQSFLDLERTKIIASALVRNLDDDIVNEMVNIVRRREVEIMEASFVRGAEGAAELTRDKAREGSPEEEEPK
jgi:Arc-like DNA binding domain